MIKQVSYRPHRPFQDIPYTLKYYLRIPTYDSTREKKIFMALMYPQEI
jgi:hypothetical protein